MMLTTVRLAQESVRAVETGRELKSNIPSKEVTEHTNKADSNASHSPQSSQSGTWTNRGKVGVLDMRGRTAGRDASGVSLATRSRYTWKVIRVGCAPLLTAAGALLRSSQTLLEDLLPKEPLQAHLALLTFLLSSASPHTKHTLKMSFVRRSATATLVQLARTGVLYLGADQVERGVRGPRPGCEVSRPSALSIC